MLDKIVFGSGYDLEKSIRQFLAHNFLGAFKLNRELIRCSEKEGTKRLDKAIPPNWEDVICKNGVRLSPLLCTFRFRLSLCMHLLHGIKSFVEFGFFSSNFNPPSKYCYFYSISPGCVKVTNTNDGYTLLRWYSINDPHGLGPVKLLHGNKVSYTAYGGGNVEYSKEWMPKFRSIYARILFIAWGSLVSLIALIFLFTKRWYFCLMLNQAIIKKRFSFADKENKAQDYIFNISSFEFRPLWTYEAESCGSKITVLNYAASYLGFLTPHGYLPDEVGCQLSTWPYFLNWSESYTNYLKKISSKSTSIVKVNPVWWTDTDIEINFSGKKCISVYDISPIRPYFYPDVIGYPLYRTFEVSKMFLMDILEEAEKLDCYVLFKAKRSFGKLQDKKYIRFMQSYLNNNRVINIHPDVSPFRLVKISKAVISAPFTSTALVARGSEIATAFYDPINILSKNDRGAQGIDLLCGKKELHYWLNSVVTNSFDENRE
jgi:polysaccharide biosynthesis PFTS motif protein